VQGPDFKTPLPPKKKKKERKEKKNKEIKRENLSFFF
jgi:hypothetical protein